MTHEHTEMRFLIAILIKKTSSTYLIIHHLCDTGLLYCIVSRLTYLHSYILILIMDKNMTTNTD